MVKQAALVAVLCGACVESASTSSQPITPYAAVDYFLILDGIRGETTDHRKNLENMILAWSFTTDDTADAVLVTDCVGFACRLNAVSASLQSSEQTADGPTSVWKLTSAEPSLAHAVARGTSADDTFQMVLTSGGREQVALATLIDCVPPPDCFPLKGTYCVPICTLR